MKPTLTPSELHILRDKGTELAFSGRFIEATTKAGSYVCRGCGTALFRADNQFTASCGWPAFDNTLTNAVRDLADADGRRQEIICAQCHGHLGHVFSGEGYTSRNTRHCVNSIAIEFVPDAMVKQTEEIVLAAGCFWGVEHILASLPGVLLTEVGYTGGALINPSYEAVCTKTSGHIEAVRVLFDPLKISLKNLLIVFFELHDFTQQNGQGPDIGPQYQSIIFFETSEQENIAQALIQQLTQRGYNVATTCLPATTFWRAEDYHQHYYATTGKTPYCHARRSLGLL